MEIQIAVAKVDRHFSGEQGDQVEVIERPNGGISVLLGEGKLNGQRSREVSRKGVHRVLSLISKASTTALLRVRCFPQLKQNTTAKPS